MRRTAVEEEAPMLEMTPVVAPGEDAKDEEAGEPGAPGTGTPTPDEGLACLLYTSPSPRDLSTSRMPSSA